MPSNKPLSCFVPAVVLWVHQRCALWGLLRRPGPLCEPCSGRLRPHASLPAASCSTSLLSATRVPYATATGLHYPVEACVSSLKRGWTKTLYGQIKTRPEAYPWCFLPSVMSIMCCPCEARDSQALTCDGRSDRLAGERRGLRRLLCCPEATRPLQKPSVLPRACVWCRGQDDTSCSSGI